MCDIAGLKDYRGNSPTTAVAEIMNNTISFTEKRFHFAVAARATGERNNSLRGVVFPLFTKLGRFLILFYDSCFETVRVFPHFRRTEIENAFVCRPHETQRSSRECVERKF